MKIAIASDIHLEFGDLILKNEENAEVLILSGDICVAADFNGSGWLVGNGKSHRYTDFFARCAVEFPKVIYISGNHEHYNGDYAKTFTTLQNQLGHIDNLSILDKEKVTIDGVTFICGTLWTDMNAQDPVTLLHIRSVMNDFAIIKNSNEMVSYKTIVNAYDRDGNVQLDANQLPIQRAEFHKRVSKFTPEYQRRLREYVINDWADGPVLDKLPNNQFGTIFAYHYFNHKPMPIICKFITEFYEKLRSGGSVLMTYNNCDLAHGVVRAEHTWMLYTPRRLIEQHANDVGFELTTAYDGKGDVSWIEFRKPGDIVSLRGGQTLAKVLVKTE
jgi:hypothetical protein